VRTQPYTQHTTLTQQTPGKSSALAKLLLTAEELYTEPAGQGGLVPLPKGLPHVPSTVTVDVALLLVALVSPRVSDTWLVRLPGVTPRTV
jgi:hypothetical protein